MIDAGSETLPSRRRGPRPRRASAGLPALTGPERRILSSLPPVVEYVPHVSFRLASTERRLFGTDPAICAPAGRPARLGRPLDRQEETTLFLRYNYAKYRLARLLNTGRALRTARAAREALRWDRLRQEARTTLTEANLPLVTAMAQRACVPHVDFEDLVSEGNMALLRSIERFDVSRGFKFSTYACRAILKSFGRMARSLGRYRRQFPVEFDPDFEHGDPLARRRGDDWSDSLDDLREILAANRARLTALEQRVLWERFFAPAPGTKRTLAEIGRSVGFSTERVRQILHRALGKTRAALEACAQGA